MSSAVELIIYLLKLKWQIEDHQKQLHHSINPLPVAIVHQQGNQQYFHWRTQLNLDTLFQKKSILTTYRMI